jgi:hypothetical protein
MKKIIILIFSLLLFNNYVFSDEKCSDLDVSKKLSKDSIEYAKCIGNKAKEESKKIIKKLNTESKLTDWVKEKFKK